MNSKNKTLPPLIPKPGETEQLVQVVGIADRVMRMDYAAYDRLTDELGKEQPMTIVLFLGYHSTGKLNAHQLGELMVALSTCWLFYRERYGCAAFPPLDAGDYAAMQRRQVKLFENQFHGSPEQSDQAIHRYLSQYEPRALLNWLTQALLVSPSAVLRQISRATRLQVYFDCVVLIACWQEQVNHKGS
jgi:hypothetical protein